MVDSLGRGNKGRYAAPPDERIEREWWSPIPIYIFLPITVIFLVISSASWLTYQSCSGRDSSFCLSVQLRPLTNGTYGGLLVVAGTLMTLATVGMIVSAVMQRHWRYWLCWLVGGVALLFAIVAFLILSGSVGTPWGSLGPVAAPPPISGS